MNVQQLKIDGLQRRIAALSEEHQAITLRLTEALDPDEEVRLNAQLRSTEVKLNELMTQLRELQQSIPANQQKRLQNYQLATELVIDLERALLVETNPIERAKLRDQLAEMRRKRDAIARELGLPPE